MQIVNWTGVGGHFFRDIVVHLNRNVHDSYVESIFVCVCVCARALVCWLVCIVFIGLCWKFLHGCSKDKIDELYSVLAMSRRSQSVEQARSIFPVCMYVCKCQ
jgi:hypothetical protein